MAAPTPAVPSFPPTCSSPLSALVAVTLTGKVLFSGFEPKPKNTLNISKGESMTISFLTDPTPLTRIGISDPTLTVHDGTAPYQICAEEFEVMFEKGARAHLGAPPADPLTGAAGAFWFSLAKSRPVQDGAWLSMDAAVPGAVGKEMEATEGVPLSFHTGQSAVGQFRPSKFMGLFSLVFERHTIPSIDISEAYGTYNRDHLAKATFHVTRDWATNIALSVHFESLTIGSAKARKARA